MTFHRIKRMLGIAIPTSMAVLAIGNGAALAQVTCADVNIPAAQQTQAGFVGWMPHALAQQCVDRAAALTPPRPANQACYPVNGSDTNTDIARNAIIASFQPDGSGNATVNGACINYINTGSGDGEKGMLAAIGIGTAPSSNQGIAFMSRNFVPTVLDADANCNGTNAHSSWAPGPDNTVALDAAIMCFKPKAGQISDMEDDLITATGYCSDVCPNLATTQVKNIFGEVPDNCPSPALVKLNAMSIILGGYPSDVTNNTPPTTATTTECAHSCRKCLVDAVAAVHGVPRIEHILRRDDKSGTQDTFRERFNFGRWCNGNSPGNLNRPGSNLNNEDLDPIRHSCLASTDSGNAFWAPTKCTYYPLNITCNANSPDLAPGGSNPYTHAVKCTQGLIVALSENDPDNRPAGPTHISGTVDITKSIGSRVEYSLTGYDMGLAGKAEYQPGNTANDCVNINTTTWNQLNNIYSPAGYKLARRLYFQRNPDFQDGTTNASGHQSTGELAGRKAEEDRLWTWVTGHQCDMVPIVEGAGFIAKWKNGCATNCSDGTNSSTITCELPYKYAASLPTLNTGLEKTPCSTSTPCVANGTKAASAGAACGGFAEGSPAVNYCPLIPVLASGYACNLSDKCSSGTCTVDSVCQ